MCIRPAVFNQLTLAAMSIHNGINRMNADVASVFFCMTKTGLDVWF